MAVHRFKPHWLAFMIVVCLGIYCHAQSWLSEPAVSATGVPAGGGAVSLQTGSKLSSETHPVELFSALQAQLQSADGPVVEAVATGLERRLSGTPDNMTIEWKVVPGVDPGQIEVEFPEIDEVEQTGDGQLVLHQQPDTTLQITGVKAWQETFAQVIEVPVTVVYQGNGRVQMRFGFFVASNPLQVSLQVVTRRGFAPNATLTVTSGGDSGAGTLRDQIAAAMAGDTIVFSGVSTVTLTSAELLINKNLTIEGGAGVTVTRSTAGGTPNFRIFNISSGTTAILNNLSVTNGRAADGGGINTAGTLTMTNSTISGNTAAGGGNNRGGGIFSAGPVTLTNCTISGNVATGADTTQLGSGIYSNGVSIFTNCTISGNMITSSGNAISLGGGIYYQGGSIALTNCTITANSVSGGLTCRGGGITSSSNAVSLQNTLVAGNSVTGSSQNFGPDIVGAVNSLGFNLIGNTANATINGDPTGNILNVSPMLGALASNGGPTQTHALLTGSMAIDAGTATGTPSFDQRGFGRSGNTDIGAFEFNGLAPTTVTSMVRASGNPICAGALVDWTVTFGASVTGVTSTNFAVVGGTGTSITNVTGSGTTWTVTVNTGTTGTASLGLNMVNSTGIARPLTNLPFTGQTYTVDTPPTVNAGSDQMVCASSPAVTLAGVVGGSASNGTWSGGAGMFAPNATTLNATYTLSAGEVSAGMVTLTLTTNDPAGPCGPVSDTVTITVAPVATANAGPDQSVCESSPVATLAGVVGGSASTGTWSGGSGTFSPNNTTLNATYMLSAGEVLAGTVTLTLTTNDPAGPCGSVSDTVTITIGSCLGLLVADTTNNRIQGFNGTDWSVIGVGTVGTGNGQFRLPEAAVVDGAGRIYVADTGNNRIQWSTDNGATWANFATNGTATNQVKAPQGLA
ncbi:MAG: hypothetical protein HY774_19415, partial [Acidobacteria bacterium]|nr:hypothetical protein [Acidobacteriota bacterium]